MELRMMQLIFYPYLKHWQLMNYMDEHIPYADINFIKDGWVNRNRRNVNGTLFIMIFP